MRIKQRFNPDNIYFTSDLHLLHEAVITYSNRPFKNKFEMTHKLIENWNKIVPKDGIVFDLGDFAFTSRIDLIKDIRSKLNGTIYKLYGNHDYQNKFNRKEIQDIFGGTIFDVLEIEINDSFLDQEYVKLFLSHYPHLEWNRNAIHLHGHIHSNNENGKIEFNPMRYDVGVDNNNFFPISWKELKMIISNQINLKL